MSESPANAVMPHFKTVHMFSAFLRDRHGQRGYTEVVAIGRDCLLSGYFDDAISLADAVLALPVGFDVFFGLNPHRANGGAGPLNELSRKRSRGSEQTVFAVCLVLVDIDVDTEARRAAKALTGERKALCTDQEHGAAVAVARAIKEHFFPDAELIGTNGAQLLVPVQFTGNKEDLGLVKEGIRRMLQGVAAWVEAQKIPGTAGMLVDITTYDLPRIAAFPGTVKSRYPASPDRFQRRVEVIELGTWSACATPPLLEEALAQVRQDAAKPSAPHPRVRARRTTTTETQTASQSRSRHVPLAPLDCLCPGWNAVYTSVASATPGGRSVVIKSLTTVLGAVGLEKSEVVQAVLAHDRALGNKLSDREFRDARAAARYVEREIDSGGHVPSCNWVIDAIGSADQCLECPKFGRGKASRGPAPKPFPLASAASTRTRSSIEEARSYVVVELRRYLDRLHHDEILLILGPPGIGKTTIMAEQVRRLIDAGRRVLIVVDRIELLWELVKLIDRPEQLQTVLGKHQSIRVGGDDVDLCTQPKRLHQAALADLQAMEAKVACTKCPDRTRCAYRKQFDATEKSWITTAAMLPFVTKKDTSKNSAEVVFLDEGARQAYTPSVVRVTRQQLQMAKGLGFDMPWVAEAWHAVGASDYADDKHGKPNGRRFAFEVARALRERGHGFPHIYNVAKAAREYNEEALERESLLLVPPALIQLLWLLVDEHKFKGPNSRIRATADALEIRAPFTLKLSSETAVVVLDGTGVPEVYEEVLGRPAHVVDPQVERNARVIQLTTGAYGKTDQAEDAELRQRLFLKVRNIVERRGMPEAPVTVVVFQKHEAEMTRTLAGLHFIVLHFWGSRGTNVAIDAGSRDIVLVGTPTPSPKDILAWAEARAWNQTEPVSQESQFVLHRYGLPEEDFANESRHYQDHRVERWAVMEREGELRQAAERIRTCLPSAETKTIWLLTKMPIPGLEPDVLVRDIDESLVLD